MSVKVRQHARGQGGYTLVELIIASALGVVLMTALTSVILTSTRSIGIATSRIEASAQIRSFQFFAYDDFALSSVPSPSGCGTVGNQCTTQPIVLNGFQVANSSTPGSPVPYQVSYTWDNVASALDRQIGAGPTHHAATGVTSFSWYVDSTNQTVVVTMTVTIQSYSESQLLRFYPRVNP